MQANKFNEFSMKQLLIVGHTFPEPSTTAAGSRMMQLIALFTEYEYEITFATTALPTDRSVNPKNGNISIKNILLNDSSFDGFIKSLKPAIVIFDRFITEEQFGWRVAEHCPNALRILDTEDLHFLRKAREEAVKLRMDVSEPNIFSEVAKREIASIIRSDLSLIISEFEMELLVDKFKIPVDLLYYLPFLLEENSVTALNFEERKNFVVIGNLLHAPNVDAVLQLKRLWPIIKELLPHAQLHIYGA